MNLSQRQIRRLLKSVEDEMDTYTQHKWPVYYGYQMKVRGRLIRWLQNKQIEEFNRG